MARLGKFRGLLFYLLLTPLVFPQAQLKVQGGIFADGTTLIVKAKPDQNTGTKTFSGGAVTIRWEDSYGVSLGAVTTTFGFFKDLSETVSGIFRYQVFSAVPIPAPSISWVANQEYELFRVPVQQTGSGTGIFELAPNGFAVDWYIEISGNDRTNSANPFYQSTAGGVPLPIQLASIAANLVRDNEVEVTWRTISETNNYGFEIQRRRGESGEWKKLGFVEGHGTTLEPQSYSYVDRSVAFGKYYYRIQQVDLDGKAETFPEMEVNVGVGPDKFVLTQNYPNPFNPSTVVEFVVPQNGFTTMKVYNILGQEVATLFEGNAETGKIYSARFDASRLGSGVYFYTLRSAGKSETKRMLLLK